MTRHPTPPSATQTTLRVPRKALLVGSAGAGQLSRHVEAEGYFAFIVADGADALSRLRAERFELVLVDVGVPGMKDGGAQFVEALRSDPHLANVPVIVTSAKNDVDAIERCLARGADEFLPTQCGPAMLHARVSAAVDRRGQRDNQNLRRDMDVARTIQRDFLPESLPIVPGVQLDAALHPARQVSGDFYDAFQLAPSGSLMLVVGDVCNKGVGAALFMALFRSLIRASADPVGGGAIQMVGGRRSVVMQSLESATPGDMLVRVAGFTNNYIARLHGRTNMFATVFMAVLDPAYGGLDYVNAGHEPALVIGGDGVIEELRPTGPALGMMPDSVFRAEQASLEPGASLFAFTDGLVEARSPTDEVFGGERLRAVLRGSEPSAPDLVRDVVDALKHFARQAEPHDDLTMLAATRESV
ncbi:MAG TPA: SpoIIE family protein phosphatase [Gemmatimonadaceae bacterium]|nr:SpoIIE family protein phosphatase [Gemmatimonadaceae bacterium]